MVAKGRTAIEGLSGSDSGMVSDDMRPPPVSWPDREDPDRILDVPDGPLPEVGVGQGKDPADAAMRLAGDAHTSGAGKRLEPCRDVDAVPEQVPCAHDHVAHVHPDPEPDPAALGNASFCISARASWTADGAPHRIDHARELGQDAVTRRVGDPPAVPGDQLIHDLAAGRQGVAAYRPRRPRMSRE